jgi:hypothetical protein
MMLTTQLFSFIVVTLCQTMRYPLEPPRSYYIMPNDEVPLNDGVPLGTSSLLLYMPNDEAPLGTSSLLLFMPNDEVPPLVRQILSVLQTMQLQFYRGPRPRTPGGFAPRTPLLGWWKTHPPPPSVMKKIEFPPTARHRHFSPVDGAAVYRSRRFPNLPIMRNR